MIKFFREYLGTFQEMAEKGWSLKEDRGKLVFFSPDKRPNCIVTALCYFLTGKWYPALEFDKARQVLGISWFAARCIVIGNDRPLSLPVILALSAIEMTLAVIYSNDMVLLLDLVLLILIGFPFAVRFLVRRAFLRGLAKRSWMEKEGALAPSSFFSLCAGKDFPVFCFLELHEESSHLLLA